MTIVEGLIGLLESIGQCKSENGDFLLAVDRKVVQKVLERFIDHY